MAVSRNWANLKSFLRKTYNREVNEWFADEPDPVPDNTTSRKQAKRACLILPKESQNMALIKALTFRYVVQGVHLRPEIYGIPTATFHESVRFKPQVVVHWREKTDIAAANNRYPIRAQCSIRWKGNYSSATEVNLLKNKIENIFDKPTTHKWSKGREKYSYRDKEQGYEMIITALNETEARDVVNKMLEIQGDNPLNEEYFTKSVVDKDWNKTEYITVASKQYKKPKIRPVGVVYFTRAELKVHGMPKDIKLVDNLNFYSE